MNNSKNLEKVSESILHEEVSNNQILCKTTLSIMDEFNQTYEDRIKYIEKEVGGECIELKYPVYCDWVRDLIIQNRTLVETLEELQREACQRLLMLEEKLRKDTIYFNGDNNYHKLENDLKNILEVIRRAREEQRWNADGLEFFDIKYEDIFGKKPENCDITQENNISMNVKITNEPLYIDTNSTFNFKDQEIESLREQLKQLRIDMKKKDAQIEEYTKSLLKLPSSLKQTYNDVDCDKIELNKHIQELKSIINEKDDQLRNVFEDKALLSNDILTLKETLNQKEKQLLQLDKASLDTHVLVVEVASKHDTIMKLRSDINILEERLRQADMQTHFKDDVIRGLRRDCRKLAQGSMFSRKYDPNQSVDRNLNIVYGRFDDKLSMSYEDNNEGDMESTLGGYDSDRTLMNSELEKNDENENKIVKLLRQELEQMVQQVRARETHILNQNSMILESQDKLDKIRIELKTITTDRDKILMQLSDLKIDTEVKEFQNLLVEMNEKIIMLEKENHELKYLKKQVKDDYLKDKVIKFDKGISVKFDDENERETQHLRELITNIFQELFENFGKELSNDVLEKLSIGDLSPVSQLILELKKEIETKDRLLFDKEQNCLIKDNELINLQKKLDEEKIANNELINNLRNFIKIQENNIYQLETNKNILEYELKELNETLTSFDNKTKGIREQKDKLEIECKNQQTTIYNLREVLEATAKRNNGNNVTSSNDIMINVLSEQLSDFFGENMKKEKQLDLFKDEILELKSKIFEMNQDYICLEKRYKNHTDNQECNQENLKKSRKKTLKNGSNLDNTITEKLHKKTNSDYILLRKDLELFNEQTRDILFQDHQITRITNILTAMDIHCKKQQIHYSKIINELSEELASLSDQLVASQQQEELMKGTAALEESIVEIEEHNDMLKKTIETYDIQLADAEHQLDTITQQNSTLKKHVTELKNELEDKEKLIYNLKLENEKYIMEINLQKSLCHCNHQSSSSTDSDRNSYNNSRMKNLQETVSQKTMDSFRAMDKIQKLTNELQKQQKSFTEEKSRLLNEHSDLVGTIGKLKSKISMVEMTIVKKDNELTKMNAKLIDFAQRENDLQTELLKKSDRLTQLEHEDYKLREVVDDLSHEVADAKTELKRREFKIINELETIKQTKVKFETNADTLEKQNEKLQQQIDILIKENGALKIDGQKLKEKLAVLEGRENTLGELFKANLDKITFQNKELNRLSVSEKNFQLAKENNKRLIGHNTELLKKYQTLQKDYVIIRDEYKNLLEVKEQALFALETARKWQNEHSEREKIVSLKIFKQNEHIRTLLDDRKLLIAKINEMHRDILILTDELDKYKDSQSGWQCDQLGNNNLFLPFRETYSRSSKITRYNSDPELNDMELKKIREVTQRIYRTRKYFENGLRESIN